MGSKLTNQNAALSILNVPVTSTLTPFPIGTRNASLLNNQTSGASFPNAGLYGLPSSYPRQYYPTQSAQATKPSSNRSLLLCCIVLVVVAVVLAVIAVVVALTVDSDSGSVTQPQVTQAPIQPPVQPQPPQGTSGSSTDGDILGTGICGTRPSLNNRILGGTSANLGDWPWMGSLRDRFNVHRCGAVLLSERWAVTAAHCVDFVDDPNDRLIDVVFGDIQAATTSAFSVRTTFASVIHPLWNIVNPDISEYDIALLSLAVPIQINNYVRPICLATLTPETTVYSNCYATGWGSLSEPPTDPTVPFDNYPNNLQQVALSIISYDQCLDRLRNVDFQPTENILCDGGTANIGTCTGDSGGPLVCRSSRDSVWHLVGITSSGLGCGRSFPAFYTRVTKVAAWIEDTIG